MPDALMLDVVIIVMKSVTLMMMLTSTTSPAPPTPCTARAAISMLMLVEIAQSKEPMKKAILATRIVILLPQMSLNVPHIGKAIVTARRYADDCL